MTQVTKRQTQPILPRSSNDGMREVFVLEHTVKISPDDPYVAAYPHLIDFFKGKSSFGPGDVVCGAHMVYGWMPTVLRLNTGKDRTVLTHAATWLTQAKQTGVLESDEVAGLARLVNNSLVGASKLLHFVAPEHFAIWDSRVYSFLHRKIPHHHRVNNVASYFEYLQDLKALNDGSPAFRRFHNSVETKLTYQVSALRALELVIFLKAPALKASRRAVVRRR
jgi:hypothetical protein